MGVDPNFPRRTTPIGMRCRARYGIRGQSAMVISMTQTNQARVAQTNDFVQGVHGIRYQVSDVARSIDFYTTHLGFTLKHKHLPEFANVALGDVEILLSGPGASGSRPMPDGRTQEPGGWNRIVLRVKDLPTLIVT